MARFSLNSSSSVNQDRGGIEQAACQVLRALNGAELGPGVRPPRWYPGKKTLAPIRRWLAAGATVDELCDRVAGAAELVAAGKAQLRWFCPWSLFGEVAGPRWDLEIAAHRNRNAPRSCAPVDPEPEGPPCDVLGVLASRAAAGSTLAQRVQEDLAP